MHIISTHGDVSVERASRQLHATATVWPGKGLQFPIKRNAGWAPASN